MSEPMKAYCFALCIVRRGDEFLLVQEAKEGNPWFFPAGRVEAGECFPEAAIRETLEEAGIAVELEGIYRIEHTPTGPESFRLRIFFVARPADSEPPKNEADEHSLRADWFTLEDLHRLKLRSPEVWMHIEEVVRGAPIAPMSTLEIEGVH